MTKISDFIKPYTDKLKIKLDDVQYEKLDLLAENMINDPLYKSVSKIFDTEEMAMKHFLDSLLPLCYSLPLWKSQSILDLGTGGGFPCLPLAVALPKSHFTAVDGRQKSVDFVARMAKSIGLTNVDTIHSRIEDLGQDKAHREKYDLVVCRALSSVRVLAEYTLPLTKNNGWSFYYKGPKLDEEISEASNAFKILGVDSNNIEIFRLLPPEIPFERNFISILKNNNVPAKYPRKPGTPLSKPL
ncbi:MAG: 16S rRNA (guanine(527)-N(7))-methyltransferase RsmG [Candidatus Riflebacteria bacterium]|nr:16S rRNA (guanine(527)-N(7))-methyltransferase RsmG [Candidatus Riflebacteria bacterium]MBR4569195.1 16S rRNA (guanine(527)-N(7))-methyltransferase RsmG [Candidatus Riflebacteria bacterium]